MDLPLDGRLRQLPSQLGDRFDQSVLEQRSRILLLGVASLKYRHLQRPLDVASTQRFATAQRRPQRVKRGAVLICLSIRQLGPYAVTAKIGETGN